MTTPDHLLRYFFSPPQFSLYDGDGKFDTTVFRPSTSTWFIDRTTGGSLITNYGTNGDQPVPGAFDR